MDLARLVDMGKDLGYEGQELQNFVKTQQAFERDERQRQREADRETAAARQRELELQLEVERARQQNGNGAVRNTVKSPIPKLPKFDESSDDMDAFLERFERFAQSQGWENGIWAISLSPLLTGKGLQVYATLSATEASDYAVLKHALLKRYELNTEGFRRKFRDTKPEAKETATQFVTKLKLYFSRWVELAEVEKSFEGLADLMVRDQFLSICHVELATFLKERLPELETLEKMAHMAEQYVDAHGCSVSSKHPVKGVNRGAKQDGERAKPPNAQNNGSKSNSRNGGKKSPECFVCHKVGHIASVNWLDNKSKRLRLYTQVTIRGHTV